MRNIHKMKTRWSEVDPMYFVRTEVYIDYYREASSELMRTVGYPYARLEEEGIQFPILEVNAKYFKPLRYDEDITIEAWISKLKSFQVVVQCRILNSEDQEAAQGKIVYGVLSKADEEPMPMPDDLKEKLAQWLEK